MNPNTKLIVARQLRSGGLEDLEQRGRFSPMFEDAVRNQRCIVLAFDGGPAWATAQMVSKILNVPVESNPALVAKFGNDEDKNTEVAVGVINHYHNGAGFQVVIVVAPTGYTERLTRAHLREHGIADPINGITWGLANPGDAYIVTPVLINARLTGKAKSRPPPFSRTRMI